MPRKYNVDSIILELLKEEDLSREKIGDKIRERLKRPVSDKTINEALMKLLKNDRISVIDYDLSIYDGVERIQSIKPDGIVFTLVRRSPIEITILFKKLESDDLNEAERALKKLKGIFRTKMALIGYWDEDLFNDIIYKILLTEAENKNIMIQRLSRALSDDKNSLKKLEDIITYFRIEKR